MDKTSIINKVVALRRKTTENGCTESEENEARKKVSELMSKYNISERDIGPKLDSDKFIDPNISIDDLYHIILKYENELMKYDKYTSIISKNVIERTKFIGNKSMLSLILIQQIMLYKNEVDNMNTRKRKTKSCNQPSNDQKLNISSTIWGFIVFFISTFMFQSFFNSIVSHMIGPTHFWWLFTTYIEWKILNKFNSKFTKLIFIMIIYFILDYFIKF